MTMKKTIRYLMVLAALLLSSSATWAEVQVRFINIGQGDATYSIDDTSCKLTITPPYGYYIMVDHIKVTKTVAGGSAQSPRRLPAIAEPVEITALNPDGNPTEPTSYIFPIDQGDYIYEVETNFQNAAQDKLLLVNGRVVKEENYQDILGDGGRLKFNGSNRLTFTKLTMIESSIELWGGDFIVFLNEESLITSNTFVIRGHGGKLTFTTEGNTPGKLTAKHTNNGSVFVGFDHVDFEQNLTVLSGAVNGPEVEIGTAVKPFVDENGQSHTVPVNGGDVPASDLSNTNVGDVLYTLDSDNDDGVTQDVGGVQYVVLGSTMVDEDVNEIIENYTPGSNGFAEHFSGLTFMVPAGYGYIFVRAKTGPEGELNVKIGTSEPFVIRGAIDFTDYQFPYACTEATYVYIYSSSPIQTAEAPDHRAGKKTTVTVGVGSVGVTSNSVQSSSGDSGNGDGGETVILSDESVTYDAESGTLTSTNSSVNFIADDAFITFPFLKFIDLRGTSITGLKVSRSEGPFNGISKNTFIYLPAGNSSDEPNVVIGDVCQKVVLDGQMQKAADDEDDESFGLSGDFVAQQVVFDYPFKANQMTAVCLPFDMGMDVADQYGTFYLFDGFKNGNVQLTASSLGVDAHVPYLFLPATDEQMKVFGVLMTMDDPFAGAPRRAVSGSPDDFYGTYEFIGYDASDKDLFRMVLNEQGIATFQRLKEGEYIRPFESYLYALGQTADSFGTEGEGVPTAVRAVRTVSPSRSDSWSALSGLRFKAQPTQKGVYIHNGQKVVIK